MSNYPNPCDTCGKCTSPQGCDTWKMRFRTIWKQFNSYQKRQAKKKASLRRTFRYEHPDVLRRYLAESPCKGCEYEVLCDVPCWKYLNWWDARMAWLKGRFGR